jgi:hypothetical protein
MNGRTCSALDEDFDDTGDDFEAQMIRIASILSEVGNG